MTAVAEGETLIPQDFLEAIATEHGVSDAEFKVLSHAIGGESAEAIAKKLGTESQVIRNRLREVYKKFQIRGMGPGKLAKLQQQLISEYQARSSQSSSPSSTVRVAPTSESRTPYRDWGDAPDVSVGFYGRNEELDELKQWIVRDRCKLLAIRGMLGIGKSSLAAKLAEQVQDKFEYVIWRSLRYAPPLTDILADLIEFLSNQQETNLPDSIDSQISRLLHYLKAHSCLLIFDSVESLLRTSDPLGRYQQGYEKYGTLLKRIAQEQHQSCLVLTTLEKPFEIGCLAGETLPVRDFQLKGLQTEAAEEIFRAKGVIEKEHPDRLKALIKKYEGHPLLLKMISTTIQDVFSDVNTFSEKISTTTIFQLTFLYTEIIQIQYKRLSELQRKIIHYLASCGDKPVSLEELQNKLSLESIKLIPELAFLEGSSLIEKLKIKDNNTNTPLFKLQYFMRKYVNLTSD